jgi:transposase-like protein
LSTNAVDPEERDRICATYRRTGNISETARIHRRSLKTVTRHLRLAGIETRPRGLTPETEKEIVRLYDKRRMPLRAVAAQTDVSYGTVHRIVREAGVMRRRGTTGRVGAPADPIPIAAVSGGTADVPGAVAATA